MALEQPRPTLPTAPDREEIASVVRSYVDTFNDCDAAKARRAFHEDAWIFCSIEDGSLERGLISDEFDEWASHPDLTITPRIISLVQAGDLASVLLGFDAEGEPAWVDLLALLRVDGVWKITNKTATHHTRAGWAGTA